MSDRGVSVVVPVYNNAVTLPALCARIRTALAGRPVELVLVDDGSSDGSLEVMARLDARVLAHGRNRGQNAAILTGLLHATQPFACVLDADLEDPPEAIPRLVASLDAGKASVAFASREEARPASSRLFRRIITRLFPSLPPQACLYFAIDESGRAALLDVARDRDYLPAVIGALGLATAQVVIARGARPEAAGPTAYTPYRRLRYGWSMLAAALRIRWKLAVRGGVSGRSTASRG